MKKKKTFGLYGKNRKKTEKYTDIYYEELEEYAEDAFAESESYEPEEENNGYIAAYEDTNYEDTEYSVEEYLAEEDTLRSDDIEGFETEEIVIQEYEVDELDSEDIDLQQYVADGYKEVEETLHEYTEELYADENEQQDAGAFPTEKIIVPQFIQEAYADELTAYEEMAEYNDIEQEAAAYNHIDDEIAEYNHIEDAAAYDDRREEMPEPNTLQDNTQELDSTLSQYDTQEIEAFEYTAEDFDDENFVAQDYAEENYAAEDYIEEGYVAEESDEFEEFDDSEEFDGSEESEDSFDTAYGDVNNHYENDIAAFGVNLQQKGKNVLEWMKDWITHMTAFEAIVACTGVVLVVAAIVIFNMFLGSKQLDGQIEAMAPMGEDLTSIGIVGEEGLLAMADAMLSGTFESMTETDEELSSEESVPETSKVNVSFVSVEKDLKIRFTDADTGELITGTAFEVILTNASGKELRLVDEDMDGIIYATDINPGVFEAVVVSTDKYKFPTTSQQVTVKKKVEFAVINIQDEVKKESQVNVAVEDTEKQDAIKEEVKLTDTVEWVESTKTLISGSEGYLLVDKNTIADPSQAAKAGARNLFDTLNVTLEQTSLSLAIGGSAQLKGSTFTDSTEGDIAYKYTTEWKSSNESVATVNNGTVTAKAEGTATITYTVTKTTITTTYEPKEPTEEVLDISLDEYEGLSDEEKQNCTPVKDDAEQTVGYTYKRTIQPEKKTSETTESASATCEIKVAAAKISSASLELSKSAENCNVGETLTVKPSKLVYTKEDGSTETIT